jgi:hypothetical protein
MDRDDTPLLEQVCRRSRTEERGSMPVPRA